MAKYLIEASYSQAGIKGVLKEGGTGRRAAIQKAARALGGKVDSFYFGFGSTDVYVVIDAPDNVTVAALSMTVGAAGSVSRLKTTVLLTPEEIDLATKKKVAYRAPGA
jgi:uncharacterized protein with GYD domain